MAQLPTPWQSSKFASNRVAYTCLDFSVDFCNTHRDWLSTESSNLVLSSTAGVKFLVLNSSQVKSNFLKFAAFIGEFSGFLENNFGPGAILANFLGCSLFKVGEHREFWALVGLPRLDTVLTFLGGDVFFTISSLLFSDNVLLLVADFEGFATSDLLCGLLCLFLLCSNSLLPVLASCLAS